MYEDRRPIWDRTVGDFNRETSKLDIPSSAEEFVKEAVLEYKNQFIKGTNLQPSIAVDVVDKLKTVTVVASLQAKVFPISKLEEFYTELNLKGDESFLHSVWEMEKNHRKIRNELKESWRRQIDMMVGPYRINYNIKDGNILCRL